jgi:gamma-glutamyltranspeptidase/glutathione hydrolase
MSDGGRVLFESGFADSVIRDLSKMGHVLQQSPGWSFGGYQAIYRDPDTGVYIGASESRSDGQAVGY